MCQTTSANVIEKQSTYHKNWLYNTTWLVKRSTAQDDILRISTCISVFLYNFTFTGQFLWNVESLQVHNFCFCFEPLKVTTTSAFMQHSAWPKHQLRGSDHITTQEARSMTDQCITQQYSIILQQTLNGQSFSLLGPKAFCMLHNFCVQM